MGLTLSTILEQAVPCPPGTVYNFAKVLSAEAEVRVGKDYSTDSYYRSELEAKANDFIQKHEIPQEQANELRSWIASLPSDERERINLHFQWPHY